MLKIANQPPEEQEYALKRVIAAAYALASPQDKSHSDLARAEAETIRNGYSIGLDVPAAQPPAEPAAPLAAQPAVAEPASPAPTLLLRRALPKCLRTLPPNLSNPGWLSFH